MKVKDTFGAVVGTGEFRKKYAIMRLKDWVTELKLLKKIISMASYCGFTSGFRQKFNYIIRTITSISYLPQPIENTIRSL